jgi:hypothetical protein
LKVTAADFRSNLTTDGAIDLFDLLTVRNKVNQAGAGDCTGLACACGSAAGRHGILGASGMAVATSGLVTALVPGTVSLSAVTAALVAAGLWP